MNGRNRNHTGRAQNRAGKIVVLLLLAVMLSGIVVLRWVHGGDVPASEGLSAENRNPSPVATDEPAEGEDGPALMQPSPLTEKTETGTGTDDPADSPDLSGNQNDLTGTQATSSPELSPDGENSVIVPAVIPTAVRGTPKYYTSETYQLVTDMVYAYRTYGTAGHTQVEAALVSLKQTDPQLGALWEEIMKEWIRVSEELTVTPGSLPDGLPKDDSLCIAVMGYHLSADGAMLPEMLGRCETALQLLQKYPNAILALTGGGTAPANADATEAEVMAQWFLKQGISSDRMIVEAESLTTGQNAKNTCEILAEQYPQVKKIAVVSSDYHIAQCELLFTEAALLHAYLNDRDVPFEVAGYAAFETAGTPEDYSDPSNLWLDVWVMADPHY